MKHTLPQHVQQLQPYQPIQGMYDIRLDANESYFRLKSAQLHKIQDLMAVVPFNRYPDPYATTVCKKFATMHRIDPDSVVAGNGSDELIGLLASVFFGKQDKVAVFEHDFSMYRLYMETFGVNCVTLPKRADLTIDVDQTIQAVQDQQISALLFSNPCNPTSLGLNRDDVLKLIQSVDALVIVDEAYMDFWDQSILDIADQYENLIVLKTCSKAIGLAGIRLGFAISNQQYIQAFKATKAPYNLNQMTQLIAEVILSDPDYLEQTKDILVAGTRALYADLCDLADEYPFIEQVYPTCTNFVFMKVVKAKELQDALLDASIAVRVMGDYLRITCGNPEENQQLIQTLSQIFKESV